MSTLPDTDTHYQLPFDLSPAQKVGLLPAPYPVQPEQAMPAISAPADVAVPKSAGKRVRTDRAIHSLSLDLMDYFIMQETSEPAPLNLITTYVTEEYLKHIVATGIPEPRLVERQLLTLINGIIRDENQKMPKGETRYGATRHLNYWQLAQILLTLNHVIRIAPDAKDTDREYDLLAMYRSTGNMQGTYSTSEDDIRMAARAYHAQLTLNDFKEVLAVLKEDSPRMHQCDERDLIAVNNGVFFYGNNNADLEIDGKAFSFKAKSLHPFDPTLVFLSKSRVNYVAAAAKPVITHPTDGTVWDVESWVEEFYYTEGDTEFNSKNEGMAALIWETIGAIVRPHVRWGKTAWFYSESGNNGKGTLCALMRNLVGSGSHTSIPLSDFGKDFALEPLVRASAVIVDENDVGTFIDKAANLKAVVTNDVIQINRKYRMPIAFQFWGFMVQCLNEFPLVKDKSESFYRRQLFVPFTKCFTGAERKYIKDDYLERRDVLEYVLWHVLHVAGSRTPGEYYELAEPLATKVVLSEYKETNDPVRAFWLEFRDQFVWDLLPIPFLYDLYKAWFADVSPSGSVIGRQRFAKDLVQIIQKEEAWYCLDADKKVRPAQLMNDEHGQVRSEPLIATHQLTDWFNPFEKTSKTPDLDRLSRPTIVANYRQPILRKTQATLNAAAATTVSPTVDADN